MSTTGSMNISTENKTTLKERLQFLERKNEALQLEVSHLTQQNTKLYDQLQVFWGYCLLFYLFF